MGANELPRDGHQVIQGQQQGAQQVNHHDLCTRVSTTVYRRRAVRERLPKTSRFVHL